MHSRTRVLGTLVTALVTALATALATLALVQAPAAAAPAVPANLSADVAGPVLSWDVVPTATGYDVELSSRSDFSVRLWSRSTVNSRVVPDVALPAGRLFWRVRAKEGSVVSDWAGSEVRPATVEAPAVLPVTDGGEPVRQPDNPALLRWTAVPAAQTYEVQVGTDPAFTDPARYDAHQTATLAWLVADSASQLPGNTYYWRVRADLGNSVTSPWSDNGTYAVEGLPRPANPTPVDDAGGVPVTDVVLDWDPVPGAARYDVRISPDRNFSTGTTTQRTVATRWSPLTTVNNDQYYWQVRPIDALGTETPWSDVDTWEFRRSWPDQPQPVHPADGADVGDPLYVQWEPVRHASEYTVELSTRPDFPDDGRVTRSCSTEQTTLVLDPRPVSGACTLPSVGSERYYWRVQGVDDPKGVVTDVLSAPVRSFVYRPDRATPTAPADGAEVAVPTMRWDAAQGASHYQVLWTQVGKGSTQSEEVATTSYTPPNALDPGTYRWEVRAISASGRTGTGTPLELQRQFTVKAAPAAAATSADPLETVLGPTNRFPTLRWTPVKDATHYRLRLRGEGDSTYVVLDTEHDYPAAELVDERYLVTGTFFWRVEAFDGETFLGVGREGRFTIAPSDDVTNHRAALVGTATGDPSTWCDMGLPDRCQDLDQTPVVRWDPVAGASSYRVHVTFDKERTSLLPNPFRFEFETSTPMWAPSKQLPDSQAGAAYFVSVRACKTRDTLTCEPIEHAEHAVNKLTSAVQLQTPADGATVADDVTFTWRDYLDTNEDPTLPRDVTGVTGTLGAQSYEIEVSTDRSFTSTSARVARAVVDQTTFTSPTVTLPEGIVHWRVRAIDASGNTLPWSPVRSVVKRSPRPVPLAPAPRAVVDGGAPFRWEALGFAATYDVEVQRNGVVVSTTAWSTKQTAFAPDAPLPAGGGYTWRVRRGDANSPARKGEWSDPVPFTVRGATPRQVSPEPQEELAPAGALFSWEVEPTASRYRFQRQVAGTTSLAENVVTAATSYAPLARIPAGRHEWRVVALDADGRELGASGWRVFTVQSAPTAPAPQVTGSTRVGNTLIAAAPDWSMPDVATSVQWYRGSVPIPGATDREYGTTGADLNQTLKARFTGTRPGWAAGTVDSVGVKVTPGTAPLLLSALEVDGPGQVGTELELGPVSWDVPDVTTTYQWLRNDGLVRGATTATYLLTPDDIGDRIAVRVTGRRAGYDDAVVVSEAVVVIGAAAPVATTPPGTTGTPRVGQTLTATPGTWSVEGLTFAYQWLRDGEPINGATRSSLGLTALDAGRSVAVRVTARRTGYADGTATSPARTVARIPSTTTATPSATRVKVGRAVTVTVDVAASGATPAGTVTLQVDGSKKSSARLDPDGEATLRYTPRSTGKDTLVVAYAGRAPVAASRSRATVLTVVR